MKNDNIPFRNHQLHVLSNDNPGAPAIIFLHGNSASHRTWEKQFDSFLSDRYHLIAFDLLGFGNSSRSDTPENDYTITSMSESLAQVVDFFNLDEYVLVGHSLGGHLIVQSLDRLPGCKGIISIGAPPITSASDIGKFYLETAPTGVMFVRDFTEEALNGVVENFFTDSEHAPAFFKDDFRKTDGRSREAIGGILVSPHFKNEVDVLSQSTIPKAFLSGAQERSINNAYYETLDFPGTWKQKVNAIEGAAHLPQWENAEAVNSLINEFVGENL